MLGHVGSKLKAVWIRHRAAAMSLLFSTCVQIFEGNSRLVARKRVLTWRATALLVYFSFVFPFSCDVYYVPMMKFQTLKCMGRPAANRCRLGRNATVNKQQLVTDVESLAIEARRLECLLRRCSQVCFQLVPVGEIMAVVKRSPEKLFPSCTLSLVGSCDRQVHNKYFADIDIQVQNLTCGV